MTTYFGFGIAPSMFPLDCKIVRCQLTVDEVKAKVREGVVPCLNPFHAATIKAMRERFGIDVPIPPKAPKVVLGIADSVIVMGVVGLDRLEGRNEYTHEEIEAASFEFSIFTVTE